MLTRATKIARQTPHFGRSGHTNFKNNPPAMFVTALSHRLVTRRVSREGRRLGSLRVSRGHCGVSREGRRPAYPAPAARVVPGALGTLLGPDDCVNLILRLPDTTVTGRTEADLESGAAGIQQQTGDRHSPSSVTRGRRGGFRCQQMFCTHAPTHSPTIYVLPAELRKSSDHSSILQATVKRNAEFQRRQPKYCDPARTER